MTAAQPALITLITLVSLITLTTLITFASANIPFCCCSASRLTIFTIYRFVHSSLSKQRNQNLTKDDICYVWAWQRSSHRVRQCATRAQVVRLFYLPVHKDVCFVCVLNIHLYMYMFACKGINVCIHNLCLCSGRSVCTCPGICIVNVQVHMAKNKCMQVDDENVTVLLYVYAVLSYADDRHSVDGCRPSRG